MEVGYGHAVRVAIPSSFKLFPFPSSSSQHFFCLTWEFFLVFFSLFIPYTSGFTVVTKVRVYNQLLGLGKLYINGHETLL